MGRRKQGKSASTSSQASLSDRLKGFLRYIFQADHLFFLAGGLLAGGSGVMLDTWVRIPYAIVALSAGLFVGVAGILVKQRITTKWSIPALLITALIIVSGACTFFRLLTTSPAANTIVLYELNRHPLGDRGDWKGIGFEPIRVSDTRRLESQLSPNYYNNGSYRLRPCIQHISSGIKLRDVFLTLRIPTELGIEVPNQRPEWHHSTSDGFEEYTTVIPEFAYRTIQPTSDWFEFNRSGHESFQITYRIEGKDDLDRILPPRDTVVTLVGLETK